MQAAPRRTAHIKEMDFNELKEKGLFVAPVEKKYLELPEPTAQDNLPDITRLDQLPEPGSMMSTVSRLIFQLFVKYPDVMRHEDFKVTATSSADRCVISAEPESLTLQPGDATVASQLRHRYGYRYHNYLWSGD